MTPQESIPAFRLLDISKSFGGFPVLKNVSFTLYEGEAHGLVGKNGAGKSTLMKIVSGVYQRDAGEIYLGEKKIEHHSASVALDRGIAMVYQDLSLVSTLSVTQNIFLCKHPYRRFGLLDDTKAHQEALRLLESLGVHSVDPRSLVRELSVGECQLVEIAKVLAIRPKVIVFDEPTVSLSNVEIQVLFRSIRKLKKQGISIIYITHYLNDILEICDRVTVLRDGERILTQKTQSLTLKDLVPAILGDEELGSRDWKTAAPPQRSGTPLLELKNASTANIQHINLSLYPGEILGLVGLLGSGRTEILRLIYGLDPLSEGELWVAGSKQVFRSPRDALAYGISLLPEERRTQGLVMDFSVSWNIVLSVLRTLRRPFLLQTRKRTAISEESIEHLHVKTTGQHQIVRYLSGGNQQKVVMAKCLASDSKILLLDDPTFGIDIHSKVEIMSLVKEFANKGNAVIFVSSEFGEIAEFCDTIYVVSRKTIRDRIDGEQASEKILLEAVQ